MKLFIFCIAIVMLTSCKSKQSREDLAKKEDCSYYNDKYIEYVMSNEKDSAFYYIDKAILCDPKDDFFKYEKVKLLLKYEDYSTAIDFIEKLEIEEKSPTYEMLRGVILLKQGDSSADKILEKAYATFKEKTGEYESDNMGLQFYKIGLDNYFHGRDYSLEMTERFTNNYKDDKQQKGLADYLSGTIEKESKEMVLFKLFNIE